MRIEKEIGMGENGSFRPKIGGLNYNLICNNIWNKDGIKFLNIYP